MAVKYTKDSSGNFVGNDQVTNVVTQADIDAQAMFAAATRLNPYQAQIIKDNASKGAPISAGVLTAISSMGASVDSKIGNNIASIDAVTRQARLANQQDEAMKRQTEEFDNSKKGTFWRGIKTAVRAVAVAGNSIFDTMNAAYRSGSAALEQSVKSFGLTSAAQGLGTTAPLVSNETPGIGQQTIAGQVVIKAVKDIGKGQLPDIQLGSGFFPSEDTGLGLAARQASLSAAKIAIKDSSGKVIGYRPRTALGDAYSNIFTLGHPESAQGQVIATIADLTGYFAFDAGLGRASELKALAKAADRARATGAMNEVANIEQQIKKINEATNITKIAKDAAIKESDNVKQSEISRVKQLAEDSKNSWQGKNENAIKANIGVRTAQNSYNKVAAVVEGHKTVLNDLKKELSDINVVQKTPKEIAKTETLIASKSAELSNLKSEIADVVKRGLVPSRGPEDFARAQAEIDALKSKLDNLKNIDTANVKSPEYILDLKNKINQYDAAYKEANDVLKGWDKRVSERVRNAKIAARQQEIAAKDYLKANKGQRKMADVLADQTLSKEQKLKAWADSLENLAGIKQPDGTAEFAYQKVAEFLTAGHGSAAIDKLARMTDWKQIWRAGKGKIDSTLAQELANATTTDEVLRAIAPFVKRGDLTGGSLIPSVTERLGTNFAEKTSAIKDSLQFLLPAAKVLTGVGARVQHRMIEHEKVANLFNGFQAGVKGQINLFYKPLKKAYETKIKSGTLVNIHDTEAMLTSIENFGKAVKLDQKTLDNIIQEVATAATPALRGYAASVKMMEATFNQYANKIPAKLKDEFRRATTQFESSNEKMSSYWATRHINGANLEFINVAGEKVILPGPHLSSELLNSSVYLPSPADYMRLISKVAKLPTHGAASKVADKLISDWWKKMQLVRPAFVIRNIAEEQLRVYGTGHISFFNNPGVAMSMWLGREDGSEFRKFLYRLDQHKHNAFGNTFSTGSDIEDIVNEETAQVLKNSFVNIISADSKGSFDDRAVKVLSLKNVGAVGFGHERFFDGVANQLRILNADNMSRIVAGATPKEVADAIKLGSTRENAVVEYFFSGPGKIELEQFAASAPEDFRNFLRTKDGVKKFLYTGKNKDGQDISKLGRILEITGGNTSLREMIIKGKTTVGNVMYKIPNPQTEAINSISNAKQIRASKKALLDSQAEFAKSIKKTFSDAGDWKNALVNVPSKNLAYYESKADRYGFVDKFFDVSTQFEKNSTYGPEFRQAYWDAINEISGALNSDAKAKLADVAEGSLRPLLFRGKKIGDSHPVWNAFKNATGNGPLSIEDAHIYADNYAREHVKELFYDANTKRLLFHQLRLVGPFMNAWEDTIHKWSKIGIENPIQVYKGIKTLNWLSSPESSSLYQMTDARDYYNPNEGFFFSDPETGQQMFWVPFVGTIMSKFAGGLTGNNYKGAPIAFATNPMSFNFALGAGSILPGVGPGVTIPISMLATWNQGFIDNMPEGIRNWLFPFGRSDFSSGIQSAILPANWNRIAGGLLGIKDTYASAYKPVMQYLSNGANYNLDNPDDQLKLANDTDKFARWFGIMRGVTGLVSPSSLQLKALAQDGNGDALLQFTLYKDFSDMLVANDGNYNKAVGDFLDTYGATAIFAIIGSSTGSGPSNWDSYKFVTKNPDVATKYGDIWGYVYPGGGLSQEMYKWNLINGSKKKLTPTQMVERANNTRYYASLDMLLAKVDAGLLDKNQFQDAKESLKLSMNGGPKSSTDFNKFDRVMFQLKELSNDNRFVDVPSVAGLRDYLLLRDGAMAKLGKSSTDKLVGSNDSVKQIRAWLSEQALWIIKDNPDFQKIFYQFFSNELEGK